MAQVDLYDIPIYWCGEEEFWSKYRTRLEAHLKSFEKVTGSPLTDRLRGSRTDRFWSSYIAPWDFNQIVGWVRLFRTGPQIRADLWYMSAKRPGRRLVKKHFSNHGKLFELPTSANQPSIEIFHSILESIDQFANHGHRKHILDLREFKTLGRFVDWHGLIFESGDA